jgi:hypothetical protein
MHCHCNPSEKRDVNASSRQDMYVDRDGNVYVANKDGSGEAEAIGINIDD